MKFFKYCIILLFLLIWSYPCFAAFSLKNNKGNKIFEKGKYKKALKKYMDAQMENPESPVLHYNMGNVYYKQKQYNKAIEEYNKAISIKDSKSRAEIYYNSGNSHFKMNNYPQSIEFYKKTLEINPHDQDAKYNIEIARKRIQQNMQNSPSDQNNHNQNQDKNKQKGQPSQGDDNQKKNKSKDQKGQGDEKNKMSKEDAKRLLDALEDDEKKTQKKLKRVKSSGRYIGKDW